MSYLKPYYLNCNKWDNDFDHLQNFLINAKFSSFCLLGGLNAHISNSQNLDGNLIQGLCCLHKKRESKDKVFDSKGKRLLWLLEDIGGVVLNGRHYGDSEGEYTFCSGTGRSVIDYCITSFDFPNFLSNFSIENKVFSDHMPLKITLCMPSSGGC